MKQQVRAIAASGTGALVNQAPTGLGPDGLRSPIAAQRYDRMTQPERAVLRGQYAEQQGGQCYHCQGSLHEAPPEKIRAKRIDWRRFPPNFTRHPVHLHHDHRTGLTIGAVHSLFNAVLWQYHGE